MGFIPLGWGKLPGDLPPGWRKFATVFYGLLAAGYAVLVVLMLGRILAWW